MLALSEVEGLKAEGSAVSAVGGEIRPKMGRKSYLRHSPVSTEAPPSSFARVR
jgi:putative transposase